MTQTPALEFWFEFASTYSYLAAAEIEEKSLAAGVAVVWRPFLLGPIFASQGWTDSPFNLYRAKGAYMWRDMERLCVEKGLAWRKPTQFPRNGLLAARVATALNETGALSRFAKAVFRANFVQDRDISDPALIEALLDEQGLPGPDLLNHAASNEIKTALRRRTEEAAARGLFGAPSVFVNDELFWGDDRLDAALAWARARC